MRFGSRAAAIAKRRETIKPKITKRPLERLIVYPASRSRFMHTSCDTPAEIVTRGGKRDTTREISVLVPLACVFVPPRFRRPGSYFTCRRNCEAALSDGFRSNAPAIHFVLAKCSLLHKPLFRIFTYVLRKPISTEPYPTSTLIPRNPVGLLNSRYGFAF